MNIINKGKTDLHLIILANVLCFLVLLLIGPFLSPVHSATSIHESIFLPLYFTLLLVIPVFISSFSLIFEFKIAKKYVVFLFLNFILLFFTNLFWFIINRADLENPAAGFVIIGFFIFEFAITSFTLLSAQLFSKKVLYAAIVFLIMITSVMMFSKIQLVSKIQSQNETFSDIISNLKKASNINEMVDYCNSLRFPPPREDCFDHIFVLAGGLFQPPNNILAVLANYPLLDKSIDLSLENIDILCNNISEERKNSDNRKLCEK